jgi:hypothetical protein
MNYRYRDIFSAFLAEANQYRIMKPGKATEYEISLCSAVYNAYVGLERNDGKYYGKCAPKKALLKAAMDYCKGSLNPKLVTEMIDSTYSYYYDGYSE